MKIRLQKFLAEAGIGSRRQCEKYIIEGRVSINGVKYMELGVQIDSEIDSVQFDLKKVMPNNNFVYFMLNKPRGCVTSCSDDKGRRTVYYYLKDIKERIVPIGRLDFNTEGLILFTNDGSLVNKLTHPRYHIQKKYLAVIDSGISSEEINNLEKGVNIDGKITNSAVFHLLNSSPDRSEILCVISEGRNRQIRKMFESVGKHVCYLKRVAVGDLKLNNLKKGCYRALTKYEIDYLKSL